jgi:hypothetical protein
MWLQWWRASERFDYCNERFGNQQKWEVEEEAATLKEKDVYGFVDLILGIFCCVCNEYKLNDAVVLTLFKLCIGL